MCNTCIHTTTPTTTTTPSSTPTTSPTTSQTTHNCYPMADVVFVLDRSTSIEDREMVRSTDVQPVCPSYVHTMFKLCSTACAISLSSIYKCAPLSLWSIYKCAPLSLSSIYKCAPLYVYMVCPAIPVVEGVNTM